jgi:glutaconate CoA-transferase, subunit B
MMRGGGPRAVITDYGILTPAAGSDELHLTALFAGTTLAHAHAATGWPLQVAPDVATVAVPSVRELETLRALHARTREAHSRPVRIPA